MEEQSKKITYESLWKAIIRPPRDYYLEEDLGPTEFKFHYKTYTRKDFDLIDFRGLILKVSIIEPDSISRPFDIMPMVIYVHANSSSRVEGINIKNSLLKKNINICSFDFEGSGYSEGEYISLGFHEKKQLKNVVDFLENYPGVGEIGLWGRSMGAATSLIYASMDKRIKAVVVDSSFTDFRRVAKEMCLAQVSLPGFLIEGAISIIGKSVYNKNKMKINEIKPIEAVQKCDIPVIFVHAKDDDMVNFQHTLDLYSNYRGIHKEIKEVHGGHNGRRSIYLMDYIAKFFLEHLKYNGNNIYDIEKYPKEENFDLNEVNQNLIDDLPKKKNKTIYEEWGIPNPTFKKEIPKDEQEDINNKKEDNININIIINNNEIKEELKENNKDEIKSEEKCEIKEKKNENINVEINAKEEEKNQIKVEDKKKEKNKELNKNEIKLKQNAKEEFKLAKNLTFYNTNKNFGSFIDECINNIDMNQTNEKKIEEEQTKDSQNNQSNQNTNKDNIIINKPRKKTIYDDLNLRPKFK